MVPQIRPATHSGSWYSASAERLENQISKFASASSVSKVDGNRVLIGPHAGYSFAGETLYKTYRSWDSRNCRRLFVMGPSHHVFFRGSVMLSPYDKYHTPFGDLEVDTETVSELMELDSKLFKKMSHDMDDDEHSFEMHMPFVYKFSDPNSRPKIIPIMISHTDRDFEARIAQHLAPYFKDPTLTFVVSSDFCHWGSRFRYTLFTTSKDYTDLKTLSMRHRDLPIPIYKSIELLDTLGMQIISSKNYDSFKDYIDTTGNTICGERPIGVLLKLIESYENYSGQLGTFQWLGYTQSSQVVEVDDSSVSYASGYCLF